MFFEKKQNSPIWLGFFIGLIFVVWFSSDAWSAEIRVPEERKTIQKGLQAANAGDTVLVTDGIYTGSKNRNIIFFTPNVTVKSENGAENCVIDCDRSGAAFLIEGQSNITIDGFAIINGSNPDGGAIFCKDAQNIRLANLVIFDNWADRGAGIYSQNSSLSVEKCKLENNMARALGGGIYAKNSTVQMQGGRISGNSAKAGSGIHASGNSKVTGAALVLDNVVSDDEGLAFVDFTLPVTLDFFAAVVRDDCVHLSWATKSETNSLRFEIWWSQDKKDWDLLSKKPSANRPAEYSVVDKDHETGFYKLVEVALNGKREVVKVVSAQKLKLKKWCQLKKI